MFAARRLAAILTLALLMATACSSLEEAYHEYDPRPRPADAAFQAVLQKYLRQGSIHHGPATALLVQVVPANWEVRTAWVNRRAEAFAYTKEQKAKDLADQRAEYEKYNAVLSSVYVPDMKWNDLGQQNSNWQVFLINSKGQRLAPVDVRRIKKRTAINEAIYPFWGPWSRLYLVKFPVKDASGKSFLGPKEKTAKLLITGAPGKVLLDLVMR